ncbi:hypothetical protein [Paracoccus beibuensis]|uniref:hypothetical protein n=1 Tax=Paracoccus beibuensis TaxID=547602 RepID=UPI00223F8904|nr:hypothetical protein [Paracoccus beibuensis]
MEGIETGERVDMSAGDVSLLRRMAPFVSLPYWRWIIDGQILAPLKEEMSR